MKTFTINSENNITVYATRKAASDANTGIAFTSDDDLGHLLGADGKRLIAIYNSLTGVTPVKKFTSSAVASKRIHAELAKLDAPVDATAKEAKAPKAPKAPKAVNNTANLGQKIFDEKKTNAAKAATPTEPAKAAGGKKGLVLEMISQPNGATLEAIMVATNWQKHTVRGFIAILGKKGTKIESFKSEAGARTYKAA